MAQNTVDFGQGKSSSFLLNRLAALRSKFYRLVICGKHERREMSAEILLTRAEEQKKALQENEELQKSLSRCEKVQREVLSSNPEFANQLMQLKSNLGKDGNFDKAVLRDILQKHRDIYENDAKLRMLVKQQEEILDQNRHLLSEHFTRNDQDVLQVQIQVS